MSTVVSAPGKVLIAGGYLVLEPAYSGIVISASSRFYTVITDKDGIGAFTIQVRSPQFVDATWKYTVSVSEARVDVQEHADNTSKNKFVYLALKKTLDFSHEVVGASSLSATLTQGLDIAIAGDNDFYSQRANLEALGLPRTLESLDKIEPFAATGVTLGDVHKTGMGSSASLITSLVSALLLHTKTIPATSFDEVHTDGRRLAHNLAQYVHCLAQGKVGSGFDVSAAAFGSHIYTRFNPDVIRPLMSDNSNIALQDIISPSNGDWNYRVEPFQLPPLTRIMLADVDAGSDTPSLVGKVLAWRKSEPEHSRALWTALDQTNQSLAKTLRKLSDMHAENSGAYTSAVQYIGTLETSQWLANPTRPAAERAIAQTFLEAHDLSESIRRQMREMGKLAGVPIEPEQQTQLLDQCVNITGVIGGGVPGAGGFDAIWLLVLEPVDTTTDGAPVARVEETWARAEAVSPLLASESLAKGCRVEFLDTVKGLKTAISRT
ncbi:phosphomevalonate kinase [Cylindrobasidium torrendii FP15055 ss-10]|uniref:Phosphomevalonate kinase n=1 Tax=Cylindrobasidium torrendii FP15055 ss-10 TaxID=1314674 RepID=A0A0D7BRG5_9AGAR|nr:phosphomevalonate kinase [Cylindrobasidium torrendii FP15055 ss-10]